MAERIEKALKYYGGNNSPVVVIKVVITHRLIICRPVQRDLEGTLTTMKAATRSNKTRTNKTN